jgi:hypothetical protein
MAKYDIDPVLQQLAQAINESGQAAAPITVSVHPLSVRGAPPPSRPLRVSSGHVLRSALTAEPLHPSGQRPRVSMTESYSRQHYSGGVSVRH